MRALLQAIILARMERDLQVLSGDDDARIISQFDLVAGTSAGGILAALHAARTTGKGCVVETSLMRAGMYVNGWSISVDLARRSIGKKPGRIMGRDDRANPLYNVYRTKSGVNFFLIMPSSQRHWPAFCASVRQLSGGAIRLSKMQKIAWQRL